MYRYWEKIFLLGESIYKISFSTSLCKLHMHTTEFFLILKVHYAKRKLIYRENVQIYAYKTNHMYLYQNYMDKLSLWGIYEGVNVEQESASLLRNVQYAWVDREQRHIVHLRQRNYSLLVGQQRCASFIAIF